MHKYKKIIAVIIFWLITVGIIGGASFILKPVWKEWNNYDTVHSFYKEDRNTVETVFLGASIVPNGIIPPELYEKYGICSYNLGMEQQPMLASYYWAKEAYRLHKNSLNTVVLDVSMLRRVPSRAFYQKSIDGMHLSANKINAVRDYTSDFSDFLSYLVPIFEYHSRWAGLGASDGMKSGYIANTAVRGYNFTTDRYLTFGDYDELAVPTYSLHSTEEVQLENDSLYYLKRLMDFCSEKEIKLVMIKTPWVLGFPGWKDEDHNAVQTIADQYDIPFIDFNYEPYISEISFSEVLDTSDGGHMNYFGASKLTEWLGNYLIQECDNHDRRGDEKFSFMEKQLADYKAQIESKLLLEKSTTVTDYLEKALTDEDNVIFMTVQDEATYSLSEEQRSILKEYGLEELAKLEYRDTYIGIIQKNGIRQEYVKKSEQDNDEVTDAETDAVLDNSLEERELSKNQTETEQSNTSDEVLMTSGILKDNTAYKITSTDYRREKNSECTINGKDYSMHERGLNLVVYNMKKQAVIDSYCFDTFQSASQENRDLETRYQEAIQSGISAEEMADDIRKIYFYNQRCDEARAEVEEEEEK